MRSLHSLPVVFHNVGLSKLAKEILVVGDNNELEVGVALALIDNAITSGQIERELYKTRIDILDETRRQCINVLCVERIGGLVKSKDTTVLAKRVGKRQSDDDGRQHLLPSGATPTHIHLDLVLGHDNL